LLVLLIIFMVIVPVTPKGLEALVPQPPKNPQQQQHQRPHHRGSGSVSPGPGPGVQDQRDRRAHADLAEPTAANLRQPRRARDVRQGDDDVNFAAIADVIDIGRAANVDHIGMMTPKIQAGQ
jgi:biopolymer transport protein TolR